MISDALVVDDATTMKDGDVLRADVCVIGSGCGGATVACRLAEQGVKVIVIEQGGHHGSSQFDQRERHMLAKIDGGRGLDTSDDGGISLTYGHTVGGASVHYWADSYRTPPDRLRLWVERFGLEGHDEASLAPHFAALEAAHHVHVVEDEGYVNPMNAKVRDVARALGWKVERVPQARRGCVRSGHCMQGCAYDAKQSQLVTQLPRAVAAGARIVSRLRAERFDAANGLVGSARGLRCAVIDAGSGEPTGAAITVVARHYVVAAGGFATPAFLLGQPGLKARLPHLGEHLFVNPCAQAHGRFDDEIIQWRNMPAAWGVEEFRLARRDAEGGYVEGGYLLMPNQLHPGTLAACLLVSGARQREIMRDYRRLGGTIAWIDDVEEGRVWLEGGRRRLHMPIDGENGRRLKDSLLKQATLLFGAGAREVFFGDVHDTRLRPGDDVAAAIARLDLRPSRAVFAAPHPGGAARMGPSPVDSVVGMDHRLHGSDNVWVADPSVFPTAPSVDPSLTIMAFSMVAADALAARL